MSQANRRSKDKHMGRDLDIFFYVANLKQATAAVLCFSSQVLPWRCLVLAWKGIENSIDDNDDGSVGLLGLLLVMAHAVRNEEGTSEGDEMMKQKLEECLQGQGKSKTMALYLALLLGGGKVDNVMDMCSHVSEAPSHHPASGMMDHMR